MHRSLSLCSWQDMFWPLLLPWYHSLCHIFILAIVCVQQRPFCPSAYICRHVLIFSISICLTSTSTSITTSPCPPVCLRLNLAIELLKQATWYTISHNQPINRVATNHGVEEVELTKEEGGDLYSIELNQPSCALRMFFSARDTVACLVRTVIRNLFWFTSASSLTIACIVNDEGGW